MSGKMNRDSGVVENGKRGICPSNRFPEGEIYSIVPIKGHDEGLGMRNEYPRSIYLCLLQRSN